jgi:hypothetical protein
MRIKLIFGRQAQLQPRLSVERSTTVLSPIEESHDENKEQNR